MCDRGTDRAGPVLGHEPVDALSCGLPQCTRRTGILRAEIDRLNRRIQELIDQIESLDQEKQELVEKNTGLNTFIGELQQRLAQSRHGKHTKRTWPECLQSCLQRQADPAVKYSTIYKLCCKEENMSVRLNWIHPDIRFVRPRLPALQQDDRGSEFEPRPEALTPGPASSPKPFPFEKLPLPVQEKILKLVLYKNGRLIHCISRLDPYVEPRPGTVEPSDRRSGLLNRFFFGTGPCSITNDGVEPGKFLSILAVSKRLCFLGAHIFYGLNTFCFSSIGEFGRFYQGSGLARAARIQHVELLWVGNQYLTAPPDERRRVPFSRRTYPLTWFTEASRLKTLVVHINESDTRLYLRRRYENPKMKTFMAAKTAGQPNHRMTRALRCVQGIDYIYQLRGMAWIRFYDFHHALMNGGARKSVQDWSFVEDVNNTATLPKVPQRLNNSQLENLPPLFPTGDESQGQGWRPSDAEWDLVRALYIDDNGRMPYDELRKQGMNADADLASYLSAVGNSRLYDVSSSSNDYPESDATLDLDSNSDSDDEGFARNRSESPLFVDMVRSPSPGPYTDSDAASNAPSSAMDFDMLSRFYYSSSPSPSDEEEVDSSDDNEKDEEQDTPPTTNNPTQPLTASADAATENARRESTGLFMTPGPAAPEPDQPGRDADFKTVGDGDGSALDREPNWDVIMSSPLSSPSSSSSESDDDGDNEASDSDSDHDSDDDHDDDSDNDQDQDDDDDDNDGGGVAAARDWLTQSGVCLDTSDSDADADSDPDTDMATDMDLKMESDREMGMGSDSDGDRVVKSNEAAAAAAAAAENADDDGGGRMAGGGSTGNHGIHGSGGGGGGEIQSTNGKRGGDAVSRSPSPGGKRVCVG